jgi:predicted transcriptional regulator YdeE
MKLHHQSAPITLIGIHVKSFPNGIKEAFDLLMHSFGIERAYYGVSWMDDNDQVQYYAMAEETIPGEASQPDFEKLTIEKGDYHVEVIHNWMSKTDSIKEVFHKMTKAIRPDKNHPCIEWYKSDEEMFCMVKAV